METTISENSMTQYLLGELPEDEQQALEERFFEDSELFAQLMEVENELIDSYVSGELTPHTRQKLEKTLLASPEGRKKLENARILRQYIRQGKTERSRPVVEKEHPGFWRSFFNLFNFQSPAFAQALGAIAIIMTVAVAWLLYDSNQLRNQLELARNEQTQPQLEQELQAAKIRERELEQQLEQQGGLNEQLATQLKDETERIEEMERELARMRQRPPSVLIATLTGGVTRGGEGPATMDIPPNTEVVRLQLPLPSDRADYRSYDATLNEASGARVLSQKGLRPDSTRSGKALTLRVPPRLLQPKRYFVMVNGQTADGRTEFVEEYHFTVVEKK